MKSIRRNGARALLGAVPALALVVALAFPEGPACGAGAGPRAGWPGGLVAPVKALGCVDVRREQGRDVLVNRCETCRVVKLEHRRPTGDVPVYRTYTLPTRSTLPLSFRGGRTRILHDQPCEEKVDEEWEEPRCTRFHNQGGGSYLLNTCEVCRTASVERIDSNGRRRRQTFSISATSYVPLDSRGAAQARIIGERNCR